MDVVALRRANLLRGGKKDGVDAYLVGHPANVRYLTGYAGPPAYLLATAQQAVLVAEHAGPAVPPAPAGVEAAPRPAGQALEEAAAAAIAKLGVRAVGVEGNRLPVGALEALRGHAAKVQFKPLDGRVEALRAVKDQAEVEEVRAAARTADRGFRMFAALVRGDDTEKDMADALDAFTRRAGALGSAYPTAVAVGDRGADPDAPPTGRRLGEGSKVLFDYGASIRYRCRAARTCRSPFGAPPIRKTRRERLEYDLDEVFAAVEGAYRAMLGAIRPEVPIAEVDAAARAVLTEAGLGEFAPAVLGHGIGLEAAEGPWLRPDAAGELAAGMVLAVCPGVHVPGWGGVRLGDTVLVTRDKAVPLTSLPVGLDLLG